MKAIGNDLIDLNDADAVDVLENRAFMQRVFTATELKHIAAAAHPLTYAWSVWGCKESAYKALRRLAAVEGFTHRKFEVAERLDRVCFADRSLPCRVFSSSNFIFAVASANEDIGSISSAIALKAEDVHPSPGVRQLLVALVTRLEDENAAVLSVGAGMPVLLKEGKFFSDMVSLTHHGRFIAASYLRTRHC
jgi:hypothetical protein